MPTNEDRAVLTVVADAGGPLELLRTTWRGDTGAPRAHDAWTVGVLETGACRVRHRGATHVVRPGDVLVVAPDEAHATEPEGDDGWSGLLLLLPQASMDAAAAAAGRAAPRSALRVVEDAELAARLLEAHGELEAADGTPEDGARGGAMLREALAGLLRRHADAPRDVPAASIPAVVRVVRDYLDVHHARQVTVGELAALAGLSAFHLIRVFHRTVGMPPYAYLEHVRVRRARAMLREGESTSRVAYLTGFADQSHLTRRFKRAVGVPPAQYARAHARAAGRRTAGVGANGVGANGVGANGGPQPAAAPRPRARPEPHEAPYVHQLETAAPGPAARGRRGAHVLTVSSDAETRVGLAVLLEAEGYTHSAPVGLHAAIAAEHAERPDLLMLDVGCDAPQTALLFAAARDARRGPPAVFLVPPDGGVDLPGFRAGTDCIVARPLSPALVLGAVRRLLAAGNPERPAPTGARYRVGPVELDVARGIVTRDGVDVRLSPTLLRALVQLARAEGRVVSRRELWRAVWDADARGPTRTIDTCIHALRRVLEADPAHPAVLITYNRRGYRLICERVD